MSSMGKSEISERFAEMERMDRRRVWESTVNPLASAQPERKAEVISVPIDMLIERLNELERSILHVRKDMQTQVATLHNKGRRTLWTMAGLVVAVAALVLIVPRVASMLSPTPIAGAGLFLEDR